MEKFKQEDTVWVIMSKNRKLIAKGVPRNRSLVLVNDINDSQRILTYSTKNKAESAFKNHGFYDWGLEEHIDEWKEGDIWASHLEAVQITRSLKEI